MLNRGFKKFWIALAMMIAVLPAVGTAQSVPGFRVGEKLSYTLSFGNFADGGYAETFVASRGKLAGRDAVELRTRFKTIGIVSASFMLIDENRTVFVDPATGSPLFIKRIESKGALPRETTANYLTIPASNLDLVTLLYKARQMGGTGTYTALEGDRVVTVSFLPGGTQHLRTDAGEFDTSVVTVTSELFSARGFRDVKLYLSTDEQRIPVLLKFKANKSEFRAMLSAIALDLPPTVSSEDPTVTPLPALSPTPIPIPTPRPTPPPKPYVPNAPLAAELGFDLGEKLNYRVTASGQPLATVAFDAVERKLFQERDSLLLTATVTAVDRPNALFRPGDVMRAQVDPETLAPRWSEGTFGPALAQLNQTVTFDPRTGIGFGGAQNVDAPFGTHNLLSLFYAVRSFNLNFSRDRTNPINDTRVAVFFENKPYIFTLRPNAAADITLNGQKVSAQEISVSTGNDALDKLNIKLWLGAESRVPLRISAGAYQADLIPSR